MKDLIIALFCVVFGVLCAFYKYCKDRRNYWKKRGVNGPKPVLFFGNFLDNFQTSINKLELERSGKFGKLYGYLRFTKPVLSVSDIELIKLITIKDFKFFTNHESLTNGDQLLNKVLVYMQDEEWRRMRAIWVHAFTGSKCRQMYSLILNSVDNAMEYFDELSHERKPLELKMTFKLFTLESILNTVFGVRVNMFKDIDKKFIHHTNGLFLTSSSKALLGLLLPDWLKRMFGFQFSSSTSLDYFRTFLNHVIMERKSNETKKNDFLEMLLNAEISNGSAKNGSNHESKRKLDESEIFGQSMQMIVAGTETTSMTLMYFMYIMATRSYIQSKLFCEIKHFMEYTNKDHDTLMSLPYLDAVLNETLRRYTPVVQFDRVAGCDYELGNTGVTIEKGTLINIPFHVIHHDEDNWREPFDFKPERFLPENRDQIIPNSFAPFGYGPRICLGVKLATSMMKSIIANTVYRFEVLKCDGTPLEPIYDGKSFTMSCEPIHVLLKKRK